VITRPQVRECPACGYSVEGLRSGVCPECGGDLLKSWKELEGTRPDLPSRRRADAFFRYGCLPLAVIAGIALLMGLVWL
jgi:hypothetical protein